MATIRTRRAKFTFQLLDGGEVTVEMMTDSEKKELWEKFKDKDGSGDDYAGFAIASFKQMVVGLDGFNDEDGNALELNEELKDSIVDHNPMVFREIMEKSQQILFNREDLLCKGSVIEANHGN